MTRGLFKSPSANRLLLQLPFLKPAFGHPRRDNILQRQCRGFRSYNDACIPDTLSFSQRRSHSSHSSPSPPRLTRPRTYPTTAITIACVGIVSVTISLYFTLTPLPSFDAPASFDTGDAEYDSGTAESNFPRFRIAEVRKHDAKSANPWVIHGDKVYDITDWIPAHPGGQVILRAAGGSIDRYWDIFTIHKSDYVYEILSQFLIGYVDPADLINGKPPQDDIEDPFADDPERDPSLIKRTAKPCNAETPEEAITQKFLTPNELFYVRNHMWVPKIEQEDADNHLLTIELLDGTTKEYTVRDLKSKFKTRTVTAVLQCSGNRRSHMSKGSGRSTNGLPWSSGAISNASWEGVLLADILADAGFDSTKALVGESETKHVQFSGLEAYGASIPIKKAIDPQGDVLLAFSMNGKPLPRDHGFPLRAIVPGVVAARSVKWLSHISLSDEESTSQWQRKDYKCFGPNQTKVDWDAAPSIQELPVQSAITSVKLGDWIKAKTNEDKQSTNSTRELNRQGTLPAAQDHGSGQSVTLNGYAFSGGGRSIIRVDVSVDAGKTWSQAYLLPDCVSSDGAPSACQGHGAWTWKRWRYEGVVPLGAFQSRSKNQKDSDERGTDAPLALSQEASSLENGSKCLEAGSTKGDTEANSWCTTFIVKATDDSYNTQPESHAATWNFRGNLATAWHRVKVCSDCASNAKKPKE